MIKNIEKIHTFAENLLLEENIFLGKNNYSNELGYAMDHVHNILNSKDEYHEYYKYELRLRLAMHFSPIEAINYDDTNENTRKELIVEHLKTFFKKTDDHANTLSNTIIKIFELWENPRKGVSQFKEELLKKQDYRCNHCHVKFKKEDNTYKVSTIFKNDNYKLYIYPKEKVIGEIENLTVEVDHIKPVSALGDNRIGNLQALCKLCNQAKSNLLTIKTINEIKYASYKIEKIKEEKPSHINRMLYFTILRANNKCEKCNCKYHELTMRKIVKNGPFTRSNLIAVCKTCAREIDNL